MGVSVLQAYDERMATGSLRRWQGGLQEALTRRLGEARAMMTLGRYAQAFPAGFHATHPPAVASAWVTALEEYAGGTGPLLRLVVPDRLADGQLDLDLDDGTRFLLLWPSPAPALLADVFPVLENLALRIAGHEAYEVRPAGRASVRAEEFALLPRDVAVLAAEPAIGNEVADAFRAVWSGDAENDAFNQLVLRAGLSWREVSVLRACFAYLRQAGLTFGQAYVERTLLTHKRVTRLLVALFHARLDPAYIGRTREEEVLAEVEAALAPVENISEDRLLRAFLELVCAVVRTNYYQSDPDGAAKPYIVLKLDSTRLPFLPVPRPMTETFVYSTRMEGLHLRTARVARGGLRWSDRTEDYRTEVLGLMKAQRVKNAVIVPHGAKGAFVVKRPPGATDAETMRQEVHLMPPLASAARPTGTVGLVTPRTLPDVTGWLPGWRRLRRPAAIRRPTVVPASGRPGRGARTPDARVPPRCRPRRRGSGRQPRSRPAIRGCAR